MKQGNAVSFRDVTGESAFGGGGEGNDKTSLLGRFEREKLCVGGRTVFGGSIQSTGGGV